MVELIGPWGDVLIAAGLIISVCGAYLSWTIMAAEVPLLAAQHGAFPRVFGKQNRHHAPSSSLWLTNIAVQLALVLIWLTGSNYNSLLTIASEMILVPYFLVGAFLFKVAYRRRDKRLIFAATGACVYGLWLLYASGLMHLLMSVLLYAPGCWCSSMPAAAIGTSICSTGWKRAASSCCWRPRCLPAGLCCTKIACRCGCPSAAFRSPSFLVTPLPVVDPSVAPLAILNAINYHYHLSINGKTRVPPAERRQEAGLDRLKMEGISWLKNCCTHYPCLPPGSADRRGQHGIQPAARSPGDGALPAGAGGRSGARRRAAWQNAEYTERFDALHLFESARPR